MYLKSILPRRVLALRHLHRLSLRGLAAETGIAPSSLHSLESGFHTDVKLSTLLRLCARFAVTPDYLLGIEAGHHHARTLLPPPFRQIPRAKRCCPLCHTRIAPDEPHRLGQCLRAQHTQGAPVPRLAAHYGLSTNSIQQILEDEYEILQSFGAP